MTEEKEEQTKEKYGVDKELKNESKALKLVIENIITSFLAKDNKFTKMILYVLYM